MILLVVNSCKKEVKIPELFTTELSAVNETSAICGGFISAVDDKKADITDRGVCWSTNPNPSIADNKTSDGSGSGSYTSLMTGLTAHTTYYVRAYATNSAGTSYGNIVAFSTMKTVIDYDGNVYNTIQIGTQVWMIENLNVTHYRDGSMIPVVTNTIDWSNLTSDACCNYNDDLSTSDIYGKLYNWYAVNDSRMIAPMGWHVASYYEWETLVSYLGRVSLAEGKLKEAGMAHCLTPNTRATNETGFTALPAGARNDSGVIIYLTTNAGWWTSTELMTNYAGIIGIAYNQSNATGT